MSVFLRNSVRGVAVEWATQFYVRAGPHGPALTALAGEMLLKSKCRSDPFTVQSVGPKWDAPGGHALPNAAASVYLTSDL